MRVPPLYGPCGQTSGAEPTCAHSSAPHPFGHSHHSHHMHQQQQPQHQQQRQPHCIQPPPIGGQRMALKLAAPPPSGQRQQQQQQLKSGAHRWQQPPAHYGPGGHGRAGSPCDGLDCDDQDSDCSCSNSLDCPLNQPQPPAPQHSSPLHAAQMANCRLQHPPPVMVGSAADNHLPPPPHHHHQNPHHAHPPAPFPAMQLAGSGHYPHRQQQQQQQLRSQTPTASHSHCLDRGEGCAFNQPPLGFHPRGPSLAGSGSLSNASPPPPPPPPPLVRQSTYSANSDTITDASIGLVSHHQQQQQPPSAGQLTPPPPPSNNSSQQTGTGDQFNPAGQASAPPAAAHHQYGTMKLHGTGANSGSSSSGGGGGATIKQRQSVSFRRPATATGDPGGALSGQPGGPDALGHHQEALKLKSSAGGGGSLSSTWLRTKQQQTSASTNFQVAGAHTCPVSSSPIAGNHHHYPQQPPQPQQQQPPPLHHHHHPTGSLSNVYQPAGQSQSVRAAAAQLLAATAGSNPGNYPDGTPLPPITSHRTNSPWMRISSIILTPIGIVIILFIVVSPLLHYLM